jgi:hypothetical protein
MSLSPEHVDNYNKNTFDDLMRTHSALKNSNFQHLPRAAQKSLIEIVYVEFVSWKFSQLMARMSACSQQHTHTHAGVDSQCQSLNTKLWKFPTNSFEYCRLPSGVSGWM